MDLTEVTSLIKIRDYVFNARSLPTVDKKFLRELDGILLLLDKKIIDILTGGDFKDYIDYKSVQEAKEAAVRITSIHSGIQGRK
jgi:hypothetical protein